MLTVFVIAVLGLAFAGLAVFATMCLAIRRDDKRGLPRQAAGHTAALTRRFLLMTSGLPALPSTAERELCTTGSPNAGTPAELGRG
jgi:hypothetical protein